MSQPRKKLPSSFKLQNGTLTTSLLLFYWKLGLACTKTFRFVEYTRKSCFNKFSQSAVDARRKCDENPNSSVVPQTIRLLANCLYGYQILDRSRHSVTNYSNDEETHCAIKSKFFES